MATDTDEMGLKTVVLTVLAVLGILIVLPTLFMGLGMFGVGPVMGGMWGGRMGWMALIAIVMQLAFIAVIVGGGYLLYRVTSRSNGEDQALKELRIAYARGELSDEEYEKRRDTLERDR